ncbi:N-acetylmuramidase family protein [Vibrio ostreicida]|uniref:N-acetylmuramidase family protein n=1 Tax=Vibrio ostreicida TaxID=526588 RepID=UPI0009706904|nr:N-acetylmuramidase family protein [Vibrio ostreicida]
MKNVKLDASVGASGNNHSEDVLAIQKALNTISDSLGFKLPLKEDGKIIENHTESPTCRAIGDFQVKVLGFQTPDYRIDAGGKSHYALEKACANSSGTRSSLFLPLIEPTTGLEAIDFKHAAMELDCDVAAIKAVSEVESASSGFFPSGLPAILFEAHIFSQYSQRRFDDSHPNISSKKWDRTLYVGGGKEYDRLQRAMALDRSAALMSASYGRYQIMGFNYKAAGYEDVEAFVRDMFLAESNHLKAFVCFIKANAKLHRAITLLDWASFARYYNGPAYAENRYDDKLQAAYDTFNAQ